MKSIYIVSFVLGVSIWFNIYSFMGYVDGEIKAAYEQGYERGKLTEQKNAAIERQVDMIREKLSQTPAK